MPVERPGEVPEIHSYLSQGLALLLLSGAGYGVFQLANHGDAVHSILGIPVYVVYPFSLVIFGTFGAVLVYRDGFKGLLAVMTAAAFFDLMGTLSLGYKPYWTLYFTWILVIGLGFTTNTKDFKRFIMSPSFLFYLLVLSLWTYSPIAPVMQGWWLEPLEELTWVSCFYLAFYHSTIHPTAQTTDMPGTSTA